MSFGSGLGLGNIFEILILAAIYYYVFIFFRGTRSAQVLIGLVLIILVFIGLTQIFRMETLNWLFRNMTVYLAVALIVIFQPEIRRALAELGKPSVFASSVQRDTTVDHIVETAGMLAANRLGALIAIEQEIGTRAIQESGVKLDCMVTPELLASIFYPHTPLHDGGVIISKGRIVAARCVFPLSQRNEPPRGVGTRHRAAMGLTEETDAVAVIVSEEAGTISVSFGGRLSRDLSPEQLRRFLGALVARGKPMGSAWERAKEQLDLTPKGIAKSEAGRAGGAA